MKKIHTYVADIHKLTESPWKITDIPASSVADPLREDMEAIEDAMVSAALTLGVDSPRNELMPAVVAMTDPQDMRGANRWQYAYGYVVRIPEPHLLVIHR